MRTAVVPTRDKHGPYTRQVFGQALKHENKNRNNCDLRRDFCVDPAHQCAVCQLRTLDGLGDRGVEKIPSERSASHADAAMAFVHSIYFCMGIGTVCTYSLVSALRASFSYVS